MPNIYKAIRDAMRTCLADTDTEYLSGPPAKLFLELTPRRRAAFRVLKIQQLITDDLIRTIGEILNTPSSEGPVVRDIVAQFAAEARSLYQRMIGATSQAIVRGCLEFIIVGGRKHERGILQT